MICMHADGRPVTHMNRSLSALGRVEKKNFITKPFPGGKTRSCSTTVAMAFNLIS